MSVIAIKVWTTGDEEPERPNTFRYADDGPREVAQSFAERLDVDDGGRSPKDVREVSVRMSDGRVIQFLVAREVQIVHTAHHVSTSWPEVKP